MEKKLKKPLFITEPNLIERCVSSVFGQYPLLKFHIKILIECFVVENDSDVEYYTKQSRWYNFGEFKEGEVQLEGGISSDFYIKNAIESYVNGTYKRQPPKIIFPGNSSSEEVSIIDSESYGIAIIGCCSGNGQNIFLDTLKETIINSVRNLERKFPFESKKSAFKTPLEWQRFIEGRRLVEFKEYPAFLGPLVEKNKDILLAQIKTGLLNKDFEFSDEEGLVQRFIGDQEKF